MGSCSGCIASSTKKLCRAKRVRKRRRDWRSRKKRCEPLSFPAAVAATARAIGEWGGVRAPPCCQSPDPATFRIRLRQTLDVLGSALSDRHELAQVIDIKVPRVF